MCITHEDIKHFELKDGAFTGTDFVAFVQALSEQFPEVQRRTVCLVMDNARIHHAREAREYLEENQISHVYLPPYSRDLNPIENVFGDLKAGYRSLGVPRTRNQTKRQIETAIERLNADMDPAPFYDRMRRFVQKALDREAFNWMFDLVCDWGRSGNEDMTLDETCETACLSTKVAQITTPATKPSLQISLVLSLSSRQTKET